MHSAARRAIPRAGAPAPDKAEPGLLRLEDNLAYRLSLLSFLVNKAAGQIYNGAGLSTHQWKILSVLNQHQPTSAQAMAQWVTLDKAAISRAVQQLLKMGLVRRKLHEVDARTIEISMTPRGQRTYNAIARRTAAFQAELLADIPDSEIRSVFSVLRRIEPKLRGTASRSRT